MIKLNFRIGLKFGLVSGVGVVLVAGMIVSQQLGNGSIAASNEAAGNQRTILEEAQAAQIETKAAQVAYRGIRMARTKQAADAAVAALKTSGENGAARLETAAKHALQPEDRERLQKIAGRLNEYVTLIVEVGRLQDQILAQQAKQLETTAGWNKVWRTLKVSSALAMMKNRSEVERYLFQADSAVNELRSVFWRYLAAADKQLIKQKADADAEAMNAVVQARSLASAKQVTELIEQLEDGIGRFKSVTDALIKANQAQDALVEKAVAVRIDMEKLIAEAVADAKTSSNGAEAGSANTLVRIGQIGLGIGLFVVLVLLASAVFSALSIARPVGRIGGVLLALANGDKAVEIPFTGRGDEIGDAARAAATFRDNLAHMEKMEAEQRDAEARAAEDKRAAEQRAAADKRALEETAAAERQAAMHALADQFETAVGNIIHTVSSASAELEATATTLTKTADVTQGLSATVATASEQASSNVQTVASATDEMSSSVDEISRQVQESSKIAGEAVDQARKTDARINELSEAAGRIGDVVKLITAIAEQTNLLALNATIEAARAGEAGKGFAVVAQEVKALASQTAKATEEIGAQISGMQAATRDSVFAIKEIGGTIARVAEIASSIAVAVEEQGAATQEIARNVQQAARGTAEVAGHITEVNHGATETGSASSQVLASAQSLARESNALKNEVAKFLDTVRAA